MALTQSARGGGVAVLSGFDHRNPKHPKIVISSDGAGPGATPSGIAKLVIARTTRGDAGDRVAGSSGPGIAASTRLPRADSSCRDTSRAGRRATAGRRRETKERYTSTAKRRTAIGFSNSAHPTPHFSLTHSHSNREKNPVRIIFFTIAKSYSLTLSLDSLNTHTRNVTQS